MRESPVFDVGLRRFDRWRAFIVLLAAAAVATLTAWAWAMARFGDDGDSVVVFSLAALLAVASVAVAGSLIRVPSGVLSSRHGAWTFAVEGGASRSGPLTVAIDLGPFLLLHLDDAALGRIWLPVQRRGLEREWHALRCAVYSPPPGAAIAAAAPLPPE